MRRFINTVERMHSWYTFVTYPMCWSIWTLVCWSGKWIVTKWLIKSRCCLGRERS